MPDVKAKIIDAAKDWAEVYMQREENGALWVKSLFAGIDHRLRERIGLLKTNEERWPGWAISMAFFEGRVIGEEIATEVLTEEAIMAFYKSGAPLD